jgi:hypothetical protein
MEICRNSRNGRKSRQLEEHKEENLKSITIHLHSLIIHEYRNGIEQQTLVDIAPRVISTAVEGTAVLKILLISQKYLGGRADISFTE